jgi:hypothetical protein
MASARSREESRNRLESLLPKMGDVWSAVDEAVAKGEIDPARFKVKLGGGLESATSNPLGLEAIVRRVGRPPMLIRNDRVVFQNVSSLPSLTEDRVRRIERFIPSVGRVEFVNHAMRWGGTGFVVDEAREGRRRVVTNRHVAKLFAKRGRTGAGIFLRSPIGARYGAKLDMREEVDSPAVDAFELPVTSIVYLADDTEADCALRDRDAGRIGPRPAAAGRSPRPRRGACRDRWLSRLRRPQRSCRDAGIFQRSLRREAFCSGPRHDQRRRNRAVA